MLIYEGFCVLALDGGPPVCGERVPLGDDPAVAAALMVAVYAHAGIPCEIVMRPLVGVALDLPAGADHVACAQAIDAELITAGYIDFQGRACVAAPSDMAHVAQAAHGVAKVTHILFELHTPFVDAQEAACIASQVLSDDTDVPYELAVQVLEHAAGLVRTLDAIPEGTLPTLRLLLDDGMAEVQRALGRLNDPGRATKTGTPGPLVGQQGHASMPRA